MIENKKEGEKVSLVVVSDKSAFWYKGESNESIYTGNNFTIKHALHSDNGSYECQGWIGTTDRFWSTAYINITGRRI